MTCSLNTFGKIFDLDKINEYLDQKESLEKEKIQIEGLNLFSSLNVASKLFKI